MAQVDGRFGLRRGGTIWYAARVAKSAMGLSTFRVSVTGTRDAFGQADEYTDVELVARRVILEGAKMRCTDGTGSPSSLSLKSRGVSGYVLDSVIAKKLGVPPEG